MGQEDKIIWIVVVTLLFLSVIALGLYFLLKDDNLEDARDFLAGNVVNGGSDFTDSVVRDSILSKSIVLDV